MPDNESRQSFLGEGNEELLRGITAGVVGLGGGGSHITQQLAHVGVGRQVIIDPQRIEGTNLNRLVGGADADVKAQTPKVTIAERLIKSIRPWAQVDPYPSSWQAAAEALRECDVVFGCVDSYRDRAELERQVRRYLTPYIDIGMDIAKHGTEYLVSGQAAISIPGQPCMWCMGILREELLAEEAADYGHAGIRQQVVWPNGVLASTAVGLFMSLILSWSKTPGPALLEYDGNRGTVVPSTKLQYLPRTCKHFASESDLGDPFWKLA
jgi:hypothetical protein